MTALLPETTGREDFKEILRLIRPGSRVLDVGCGEGALLELLSQDKGVDGRGVEISPEGVAACLARGLSVVQGDADHDLDDFPSGAFHYAVLSQTLQAVRQPRHVLSELLRIADRAIVSFPNFGHWRVRWSLLHRGRMPETKALPDPWWATANIHLCTLRDFMGLAEDLDLQIESCAALTRGKNARSIDPEKGLENWRAEAAIFMLSRRGPAPRRMADEDAPVEPAAASDLFNP